MGILKVITCVDEKSKPSSTIWTGSDLGFSRDSGWKKVLPFVREGSFIASPSLGTQGQA